MSSPRLIPFSIPTRRISTSPHGMPTVRHPPADSFVPNIVSFQPCVSRYSLIFIRAPVNGNERAPLDIVVSSSPSLDFHIHISPLAKYWSLSTPPRSHKLFPVYMLMAEAGIAYIALHSHNGVCNPRIKVDLMKFYHIIAIYCASLSST